MLRQNPIQSAGHTMKPNPSRCRRVNANIRPASSCRAFSSSKPCSKERLVILGSGWGGYEILRGVDKKRWDVTVVSPNNYFNFTPLLAGCAVGTLEFRCAIEPVRRYTPQVTAYQAWCDNIDFKHKTLLCMPATPSAAVPRDSSMTHYMDSPTAVRVQTTPFHLSYDRLAISVGAYSQTFNTPGVKENAHFLKDVTDARMIRTRILECLEQANQPTLSDVERRQLLNFCIVGGGPTGVEFAAELHDLLHNEVQKHYPALARLAKINLYDVAPKILGSFDRSLVQYAENTFRRDGISIWTSHHVSKVEPGKMIVQEQGEVPFGLLVWSTGLAPNPLVTALTGIQKHSKTGSLITDDHLNVLRDDGSADPDVFAIGDAATIRDAPLPATAQVANQQGKYIVKKLNKIVRDQRVEDPFRFKNFGSLAYISDWEAGTY